MSGRAHRCTQVRRELIARTSARMCATLFQMKRSPAACAARLRPGRPAARRWRAGFVTPWRAPGKEHALVCAHRQRWAPARAPARERGGLRIPDAARAAHAQAHARARARARTMRRMRHSALHRHQALQCRVCEPKRMPAPRKGAKRREREGREKARTALSATAARWPVAWPRACLRGTRTRRRALEAGARRRPCLFVSMRVKFPMIRMHARAYKHTRMQAPTHARTHA